MIFKSISFFQYRCFMDGEVQFIHSTDHLKSINLIVAPNGAGKTELLFAFWWVLYGFDFTTLLNKEETPYALNSEVYRKIFNSPTTGVRDFCSVKLVFEHDGNEYIVYKKEYYEKISSKRSLKLETEIEFSSKNNKGVSSIPNRDVTDIEKILETMIPKRVLNGIIFDGERMQRISSADEKSIESIQGVINDVTNKVFVDFCISSMDDVSREYNSELRRVAKAGGHDQLVSISQELDDLSSKIANMKREKEILEEKEKKLENRLIIIRDKLKSAEETRNNATLLETKTKDKKVFKKLLDDKVEDLFGELSKYGYTLSIGKLISDVENLIKIYNVPIGLTVETVEDILKRSNCICGTPFNEQMRENLRSLQKLLPPDNLNAVITEKMISLNSRKKDTEQNLHKIWQDIKSTEKLVEECEREIGLLSSRISIVSEDANTLEKERGDIERQLGSISSCLIDLPMNIEKAEGKYQALLKDKARVSEVIGITQFLTKRSAFVEKARIALLSIQEKMCKNAQYEINNLLKIAYAELAEDYENGRGVHITQHIGKPYRIINYYSKHVEEFKNTANWEELAKKHNLNFTDLTDEIKDEISIIENAVSKSTGQSKSVTIAFVKAILDYSCIDKGDDEFQIKKTYPLVIDAPFTDLSGKNLIKPALKLNTFSQQIILMLAPSSYEMVAELIRDHIGIKYEISKEKDKNKSIIV